MTPTDQALALVVEALREFGIKCASELNVTGTVLRFADEKAEAAAKDLLAKLAATTDEAYQRGYAEGGKHALKDALHDQFSGPRAALPSDKGEAVAWFSKGYELPIVHWGREQPTDGEWQPLFLHPARPDSGWREIGSAPKDGTRVLCVLESGYYVILQWNRDAEYWQARPDGATWTPKHWMPLPPQPNAEGVG